MEFMQINPLELFQASDIRHRGEDNTAELLRDSGDQRKYRCFY